MTWDEFKSRLSPQLIRAGLFFFELPIVYYINKLQYRSNIAYMGEASAYLYHLIRVVFYIASVAGIYILVRAYLTDSAKLVRQLNQHRLSKILVVLNVFSFAAMIFLIVTNNLYEDQANTYENLPFGILAHVLELVVLGTIPFLIVSAAEWLILFRENLNRPIKILLILTFFYVGYVDRIISSFIGNRLIKPTVSLAQFFYQFSGGEIHIARYTEHGLPVLSDKVFSGVINPGCAGYEGISFIALFLWLFMPYLRRAFALYELCLVAIFCMATVFLMNAVRLALLMYVGEHFSPKIAEGGFHTNFGVLTLVLISTICMGAAWLKTNISNNESGNNRDHNLSLPKSVGEDTVLILPLIILLAASLMTGLLSDGFSWLYPVPVTLAALSLILLRGKLTDYTIRSPIVACLAGLVVFVIWLALIPRNPNYEAIFVENLYSHGSFIALLWLVFRVLGSSIVVPVAEELAFRGALWDVTEEFLNFDISLTGKKIIALIATSVAFGFLHDDVVAAIIAGFIYGALRFYDYGKSSPIIAHVVTNSLIALYAIVFGAWTYW